MNTFSKAICWSLAIIVIALAGHFGAIDKQAADTLTIALPAVAWMAIRGRTGCLPRRA